MDRPVRTQMPATPIPPTSGSKGAVEYVTHVDLPNVHSPENICPSNDPGPLTAPSSQGPERQGTKQYKDWPSQEK